MKPSAWHPHDCHNITMFFTAPAGGFDAVADQCISIVNQELFFFFLHVGKFWSNHHCEMFLSNDNFLLHHDLHRAYKVEIIIQWLRNLQMVTYI